MMPRQEVGLIVAAIALSRRVIGNNEMGAVILMILVTAVITPPLLSRLFDKKSGRRARFAEHHAEILSLRIPMPSEELAGLAMEQITKVFRDEQFYVYRLPAATVSYELRKEQYVVYIHVEGKDVVFSARPGSMEYARLVVLEATLHLERVFKEASSIKCVEDLRHSLMCLPASGTEIIEMPRSQRPRA
jgi:hypothetical protein